MYYFENLSLAKIGKKYGVTREAIRQNMKVSIKKIQEYSMKAYILPIMFAVNGEQELCLLSSKDNTLILPVRELEYPEFFQKRNINYGF